MGLEKGLRASERLHNITKTFKLRGPAGLFKGHNHMFCWGILEACDENPRNCPIDVITFHAKGQGRKAEEIVEGGIELVEKIMERFPMLGGMKYSNTEADPIKRWSEARDFQSDIRYATVLTATVLQHWRAIFERDLADLDSISHDNSFLSYHPFEFEQRTLLARFQMNLTNPRSVQFVQKPVYAALGILGNLGDIASNTVDFEQLNVSMIISRGFGMPTYYAIVLTSVIDLENYTEAPVNLTLKFTNLKPKKNETLRLLVEAIDARTNPLKAYQYYQRPPYPNSTVFEAMRSVQDPIILRSSEIPENVQELSFNVSVQLPFVALVRICGDSGINPGQIKNIRLRKVDDVNLLVFWTDHSYSRYPFLFLDPEYSKFSNHFQMHQVLRNLLQIEESSRKMEKFNQRCSCAIFI